jgi:hypothetical protein
VQGHLLKHMCTQSVCVHNKCVSSYVNSVHIRVFVSSLYVTNVCEMFVWQVCECVHACVGACMCVCVRLQVHLYDKCVCAISTFVR